MRPRPIFRAVETLDKHLLHDSFWVPNIPAEPTLWALEYHILHPFKHRLGTNRDRPATKVKTGYEWNKYNQTHYDHDNPPPKIVQGIGLGQRTLNRAQATSSTSSTPISSISRRLRLTTWRSQTQLTRLGALKPGLPWFTHVYPACRVPSVKPVRHRTHVYIRGMEDG